MENVFHKGGQNSVEIPNGCLILFTEDNLHVGFSIFHRVDGSYPSNRRLFSYIVEKEYITSNEDITSIQKNMLSVLLSYL